MSINWDFLENYTPNNGVDFYNEHENSYCVFGAIHAALGYDRAMGYDQDDEEREANNLIPRSLEQSLGQLESKLFRGLSPEEGKQELLKLVAEYFPR